MLTGKQRANLRKLANNIDTIMDSQVKGRLSTRNCVPYVTAFLAGILGIKIIVRINTIILINAKNANAAYKLN